MTEELELKLQEIYNNVTKAQKEVIDVFVDYFGEDLVDSNIKTFEEVLDGFSRLTFRSCLPPGTVIDAKDDLIRFSSGDKEFTLNKAEARSSADKPFLTIVSIDMFPFFEEYIYNKIERICDNHDSYIIVRFPEVRVTNENDDYIDIKDLYAKISITIHGGLINYVRLTRSTYTATQYFSDYAHSHLPGIPNGWVEPCYGSGPILRTMETLRGTCDLNYWGLLCYELEKYVSVESLEGIPYRRLDSVGVNMANLVDSRVFYQDHIPMFYGGRITGEKWKEFLMSFLDNYDIKFSFFRGRFGIGESTESLWVKLSKAFAEWYNQEFSKGILHTDLEHLVSNGILSPAIVANGKIYNRLQRNALDEALRETGKDLFLFKGEMIKLKITDIETISDISETYLINCRILHYLITRILKVLNYECSRKDKDEETPFNKKYFFI